MEGKTDSSLLTCFYFTVNDKLFEACKLPDVLQDERNLLGSLSVWIIDQKGRVISVSLGKALDWLRRHKMVLKQQPEESLLLTETANYFEEPQGKNIGLTLSWHNLSVWVKRKTPSKYSWIRTKYERSRILNSVSGLAQPGELLAIMGPSGAGKTTLLANISKRLEGDSDGHVLINGESQSKKYMLDVSGFVPQHDLTLDSLTVLEHMRLMAFLKMDRRLPDREREERIMDVLLELGIMGCARAKLCDLAKGERKRVSLAVQLLTYPGILFCDEPTTGMDSYTASSVVEQLKRLANRGITVICTIHQPASGIFDMFESVYLLVSGGRMAFYSKTAETNSFFNSMGIVCPSTYNIADFLVSQLALTEDVESHNRINKICDHFRKSKYYLDLREKLDEQMSITSNIFFTPSGKTFDKSIKRQPKTSVLKWLLWRSWIVMRRSPQDQLIRFISYLLLSLLISLPYLGLTVDQQGIQNMQGVLYLVIVETIFTFNYSVFHTFPAEIDILLREVGNGLYSPDVYYISKIIMLLPRAIFEPICFALVVFCTVGLFGGAVGFIQFCLPVVATAVASTAYGCLISATFESVSTGTLASVPYEQITLLFCGLYLSLSNAPIQFVWIKYVSLFYYGLEALSISQWRQVEGIPCSEREGAPCIPSGEGVLVNYGYHEANYVKDLVGLASLYCAFHCLGFLAFLRRSKKQAAY